MSATPPTGARGAVRTVAAFDFDGTLTTADSVVPFLRLLAGRRALLTAAPRRPITTLAATVRADRDQLRAIATGAVFRGRPHAEVRSVAERHAADIIASRLRDDTVGRLAWHLARGHEVVIVSASHVEYVVPVAEALGVVDVLATSLEIDGNGRCTGRLLGANCRGREKVRRLEAWWSSRGWRRSEIELWAYGDSAGDAAMLAAADHPVRVGRSVGSVAASPHRDRPPGA